MAEAQAIVKGLRRFSCMHLTSAGSLAPNGPPASLGVIPEHKAWSTAKGGPNVAQFPPTPHPAPKNK